MTDLFDGKGGVAASGRPALARLLPLPVAEFAENYWSQRPLAARAADLDQDFSDLFDSQAVDELIGRRGLRAPFLRVAKDGVTLPDSAFTRPGGVGAAIGDQVSDDRLLELFASGSTIVLQGLHRTWGPLIDFAGDLGADLGHPVQVNAYVTPAQNKGFSAHYDVHDVFVLQIAGTKRWLIRQPVHPLPLRDQTWERRRAAVEAAASTDPLLDLVLAPGDCLYLPRGYIHSAAALGEVSIHLTIGIHPWTRTHLAEQLVQAAVADLASVAAVRDSLPLGLDWDREALDPGEVERVKAALIDAVQAIDPARIANALATAHRGSQRAAPVGPLAQVAAADSLTDEDILRLRPRLAARLMDGPESAVLVTRAGRRTIEPVDLATIRKLLADGHVDVATVGMDVARRLLLAGLVTRHTQVNGLSSPAAPDGAGNLD